MERWRAAVAAMSRPPHIDIKLEEAVRSLIEAHSRFRAGSAPDLAQDVYRTAYALAHTALEDMGQRAVVAAFRDALENSIAGKDAHAEGAINDNLAFFGVLSDAYWQAYVDNLKRTIRNQAAENTAKELHLAKYIQQYLLPKKIPVIDGYEFAGRLVPASEVGGDYWSVKFYPEDGIVTFKLADIAGHGIASATLVAAVKFISGGYYPAAKTAAAVMNQTNHVLVKETPSDILVTMIYGWLHPESGDINIVNAGHSPIFIQRGEECIDIPPTGPVLGLAEKRYGERRLHLEPKDVVFTCSDGITEARRGKEMFGVERVKRIVADNRGLHAEELIDAVIAEVENFSGGPTDDLSVLVIRVLDNAIPPFR
ncbi:MAG TPA: SpoIIE family protein phosphatase [Armatimonadota bacterium]|jgi:hypothetical protein